MDILAFNTQWIAFNIMLALIPILFGNIMLRSKSGIIKLMAGLVWFFFLPNTLYLLTDIINILRDVGNINGVYFFLDIIMYVMLTPIGIVTYVLAVAPFEEMLLKNKNYKKSVPLILFLLYLTVGFGIILGRVQRANSWEVLTNPVSVIYKSFGILRSLELILFVVFYVVISHFIYTFLKKDIVNTFKVK